MRQGLHVCLIPAVTISWIIQSMIPQVIVINRYSGWWITPMVQFIFASVHMCKGEYINDRPWVLGRHQPVQYSDDNSEKVKSKTLFSLGNDYCYIPWFDETDKGLSLLHGISFTIRDYLNHQIRAWLSYYILQMDGMWLLICVITSMLVSQTAVEARVWMSNNISYKTKVVINYPLCHP